MMIGQYPSDIFSVRTMCHMHQHQQDQAIDVNPLLRFTPYANFLSSILQPLDTSMTFTVWLFRELVNSSRSRFPWSVNWGIPWAVCNRKLVWLACGFRMVNPTPNHFLYIKLLCFIVAVTI